MTSLHQARTKKTSIRYLQKVNGPFAAFAGISERSFMAPQLNDLGRRCAAAAGHRLRHRALTCHSGHT